MKKITKICIGTPLLFLGILFIYLLFQQPSLERNWAVDQQVLAHMDFKEDSVNIKNIRDFDYSTTSEYTERYYDRSYILDEISSVDFIIEPFGEVDGPAHTMLSFGFKNGEYIVVSSEIRKEVGESFSPYLGILRQYEMVYVIGSEHDLIKLRSNYRKDDVIMYPIKIEQEKLKQLFLSTMKRAQKLTEVPEFYNTFTNTCATSILEHVNEVRGENNESLIQWGKHIFLPSHSDSIAYDLGLIDTELTLEEARKYYKINTLSEAFRDDNNYSKIIRKERK